MVDPVEDVVEAEVESEEVVEETTLTEEETEAYKHGWRPQEEYKGQHEWVDAHTYLIQRPLFGLVANTKAKYNEQQQVIDALAKQIKDIKEASYQQAMRDLKAARREAVQEGEYERVEELEEHQKRLEAEMAQPVVPQGPPPEFFDWLENNQWYENDPFLRRQADIAADAFTAADNTLTPSQLHKLVEEEIKSTFPQKFNKPKRGIPTGGGGGDTQPKNSRSKSLIERLTPTQRQMGQQFVDAGAFDTVEDYAKSLLKEDK
jgi:hypothetical protein